MGVGRGASRSEQVACHRFFRVSRAKKKAFSRVTDKHLAISRS